MTYVYLKCVMFIEIKKHDSDVVTSVNLLAYKVGSSSVKLVIVNMHF